MKLIFERSASGRASDLLPACDVKFDGIPAELKRTQALNLPELSELDVSRHYSDLVRHVYGVNDGFYPLGSCTMKYNPCVNEDVANLPGFQNIHPLQPVHTVQGCLEVLHTLGDSLCELVGMDAMTFQPAAGAHGEFTGLLMIKSYLRDHGQTARNKIIVPDSAHGTNPASSVMAGFEVISIPSAPDGSVDLDALRSAVGDRPLVVWLPTFRQSVTGMIRSDGVDLGTVTQFQGADLDAVDDLMAALGAHCVIKAHPYGSIWIQPGRVPSFAVS